MSDVIVSVDWLAFTFKHHTLDDVFSILGFDSSSFYLRGYGKFGYNNCLHHFEYKDKFTISFNDDFVNGIHVDCSGTAVDFLMHYDIFRPDMFQSLLHNFFITVCPHVAFTRLDLAIDDVGCKYFTIKKVISLLRSGHVVGRFKRWNPLISYCYPSNQVSGATVYVGSRSSDSYLRIYDKRLETLDKLSEDIGFECLRWELELKHSVADTVALRLSHDTLTVVCFSVLCNYIRFIKLDNKNVSRCSDLPVWTKMTDGIKGASLGVSKKILSVDMKKAWIERNISRSLALCDLADSEFVNEMLYVGSSKLKDSDYDLICEYTPGLVYSQSAR